MLNASVDCHHFRMIAEDMISFYLNGLETFYDDDAFCANHPANVAHNYRGRHSYYFNDQIEKQEIVIE
jgi:hypothetical protein